MLSTKQSAEEDSLFYFFSNLESFDKRVYNLFSVADFTQEILQHDRRHERKNPRVLQSKAAQ